jgi:hypothetical protein
MYGKIRIYKQDRIIYRIIRHFLSLSYRFPPFSSSKFDRKGGRKPAAFSFPLSLAEALAVGALILHGIGFMSTHLNPVQRAIVLRVAVVSTGLNGAFDALICMIVHIFFLLFLEYGISIAERDRINRRKNYLYIAFCEFAWYDV